jgi:hypothetical protein
MATTITTLASTVRRQGEQLKPMMMDSTRATR